MYMGKSFFRKKIESLLGTVYFFVRYLICSSHRKGHGVHSPFVFDFLHNVLFDKTAYPEYNSFNSVISSLKVSEEKISVRDIGGISTRFSGNYRKVNDLLKTSSIPSKYGRLLFRIVRYYKPASIVEFGTSIGLSAIYLATGNTYSKLLTVEGNRALCEFASGLFNANNIKNIDLVRGDFNQFYASLPKEYAKPHLVFIDGNHQYDPTMQYFRYFLGQMEDGIIIIDDIYWSVEMREAWNEIVKQNKNYVTIDLFRMGIILLRDSITPGHYVVRF